MNASVSPFGGRIRAARPGDLDALMRIEAGSFRTGGFNRRQMRYLLTRARGRIWVAEERREVLGFVILLTPANHRSARIYDIATTPAARGRGISRALIGAAWRWAQRRGYTGLHLEVQCTNRAAIRLYERLGFRRAQRLPDYYGEDKDGWKYRLG